jgi:endo-1,4-beta-xylanase
MILSYPVNPVYLLLPFVKEARMQRKTSFTVITLLAVLLITSTGAAVQQPTPLILNGDFATPPGNEWGRSPDTRLKLSVIPAQVDRYDRALRLESTPPTDSEPWSVVLNQQLRGQVFRGEAVYVRAWARSPDKARIGFMVEQASPPHSKFVDAAVRLTPEWKEYRFAGYAPRDFNIGEAQLVFFLGYGPGTVELAGVRVENYGKVPRSQFSETRDYWGGQPHPDTWRAVALARIEKIRKGDLTVKVVDAKGKPVPGAAVKVEMKRHHFRFGTAGPAARLLDTSNPDNLRYQREVKRLFNTFTFENDLKWDQASPETLERVDKASDWLKSNGFDVRGHTLVWGSFRYLPQSARSLRGEELRNAIKAHITEYVSRMSGKVYIWDVVNEAGSNTEVWESVGWQTFADVFKWAGGLDPYSQLCYNDYNILNENASGTGYRAKVAERIRFLLANQAPVHVLGIQGHMGTPLTPIHRVLELLDLWAEFGKPLEITEYDLGVQDDKVHGDYSTDFLIACFSHPKVQSFIMWGFWEGSHWRANQGGHMFRRDWTKRPAATAYEDLVLNKWWTRANLKAASNGQAKTRAFYGTYAITASKGGRQTTQQFDLRPGGPGILTLRLSSRP